MQKYDSKKCDVMDIEKVLLIDDNDTIRLIVRIGLESHFKVFLASSGPEGIVLAEAEKPDIILLDVRMPGMNGPETLLELKRNPLTANIPVIFMTASVQKEEIETYKKLSVIGVIEKPFSPLNLAEQLSRLARPLPPVMVSSNKT
jgi:CheY-like chemotaxis protein